MSSRSYDRPRSVYNYSTYARGTSYGPDPYSYMRARSLSREASAPRNYRSSSVATGNFHLHRSSIDRDFIFQVKDTSNKLENVNKDYHDMHATFVSKRWENKHYLSGVQDTVVDQGVQLNRILRLLEEDEMALYRRCNLYDSKYRSSTAGSGRYSRSSFPFRAGLESSAQALKRHRLFESNYERFRRSLWRDYRKVMDWL